MNELEKVICNDVMADHQYVVDLRRYFHMNPETAKEEFGTAKRIEEELDKLGIEHKRVGETGVYAEIKGNLAGDKTIVLRADIDALDVEEAHECPYKSTIPGKMHACGHDAHAAALVGAARILAANKDKFGGTVRLTFQQGEEIGYGARLFVDGGYLDGADRTFGIHVSSAYDVGKVVASVGPNNASVDWFRISVHGKSAHVSTPHLGVDALYIASQIVVAIQALITRRTNPLESILIGIGKLDAGTAYNVVAEEAAMEGTIRVFSPELRKATKERIELVASSIAAMYGGTVSIEWKDFTSPLINDEESTLEVRKVLTSVFGKESVVESRTPSLGGDDFAEYILKVPGCYAFVGSRNPEVPETGVAHHNSHFDVDDGALSVMVNLMSNYAIEFLNGEV